MIRYTLAFIAFLSTAASGQEQRFGIGTQLGLFGAVPVAGIEFLTPVSESLHVSYAYVGGQTSLADDIDQSVVNYVTKADFSLSEASLTLRWMLSRSFYIGAGAGYRSLSLDMAGRDYFDNTYFDGSLRSESLQAKILIGNSWNFSNGFYLAVDWIGFGLPLTVNRSELEASETDANQTLIAQRTSENDPEFKRLGDKFGHTTMGTLMTLRLGFKF